MPEASAGRPRRYDLIVFDWDGTLMDSTPTIAQSIQLACRDLGLPVPSRERASHVIGLGLHDALRYAVPDLDEARIPELVERYRFHYLGRDHELVLFAGAHEMLLRLKERGFFLGVATGKSRLGLTRALGVAGIGQLFDATRCADESFSKPHPGMLLDLTDLLGVERGRALMIGDTTHDLQMAANARVDGLGVAWGAHPRAELEASPSLGVFASVPELAGWLEANA
ncbi:HAD family hydrolase [Derxia gummosa]|uniref:HAD family hydrolase n=1 Tax=Derxia gummosa DSM 723 TaxID=1121388 RepID=A0A8B6X729_9BURK|nr:HAD-IA family hydrolase [Derxia gummosa]